MKRLLFRTAICWSMLLVVPILSRGLAIAQGRSESAEPGGGLIVNLAADALVLMPNFGGKLGELSREEIEEAYRKMIDRYADSQVSHVFLNANYQRACYTSDAWDSYWDIEDPGTNLTAWHHKTWLVHQQGVDLYAVCIERCRAKGISPWVSMRMNDTHYINDPHMANTFWKEHPEYRCEHLPGLNFALPEVRRHTLKLVEELLSRYDIDGIELDWMRFADQHFNPKEARAGRAHLNKMMRVIRRMADKAGKQRGRPIQVAARIPAVPSFALGFGMEGATWVKKGWIDMLIASPLWRPSDTDIPIGEWRKRIGKVDRPYQLVAATDLWIQSSPGGKLMADDAETTRGFAAVHFDRGADQIYLFNHFGDLKSIRNDVGALKTAVVGPRRHVLSFHHPVPRGVSNPTQLPATLKPAAKKVFSLPIGPQPRGGQAVVRIGLEDRPDLAEVELECRVNESACQPLDDLTSEKESANPNDAQVVRHVAGVAPRVLQFEVPLDALRRDMNDVSLSVKQGKEQKIVWLEIYLVP